MPLIDRVSGKKMLLWSSVLQVLGFVPFILFDVDLTKVTQRAHMRRMIGDVVVGWLTAR